METVRQDSPQGSPKCSVTTQTITYDPATEAWLEAWEEGEWARDCCLFPVRPHFPALCPDLSPWSCFTMVTWASRLCLHRAKWPEDKGSQWPRERKGRRMINPDIRVTREEEVPSLAFQGLPLWQDRRSLPHQPLDSGWMLRPPFLLWNLDTAGSVTASSCSVQAPLWGHFPRALRCQSHRAELWEGEELQKEEGPTSHSLWQPVLPIPRGRRGLMGCSCWSRSGLHQ